MSAIFSQNDSNPTSSGSAQAETFIGPSVKLEGNFNGDGDVVVEGILRGTLTTNGNVTVGAQAVIEAEVHSQNATIAGTVKGNISVDGSLRLAATANIIGNIKTSAISIEEGAVVNGKLSMGKEKAARHAAPPKEKAEEAEDDTDASDTK